ncbi:chromate transporter [Bordetella genomosp. 11]|uniref:Chromate transporter n=1 Tax=Bordetella genomosp. 11 TaxID=1416808 RepID=A0A261UGQ9_9BORD|nr:chromate transporter [Bordetella genomosp. 11]OZI60400.1 chromate transporter [Bordetella genomosp. 11]
MIDTLIQLGVLFTQLSLLAFGGGNTILPEMQRQVVDVHHWMTAENFTALFALAQAAPGPNLMIVPMVGWHIAGLPGMLVSSFAKFVPSSIVVILVMRLWERFKDKPWRAVAQAGIFPVTVGLLAASAALITEASVDSWLLGAIAAVVAVLGWRTRLHPLWLLLGGALVGLATLGVPGIP